MEQPDNEAVGGALELALGGLPPGVSAEIGPLFPWPDDAGAWLRARLLADAATQAEVKVRSAANVETDLGWPFSVFEVTVNGEARLLALYHFLEWAGAAVVRGALDDAARARILAALAAARPAWRRDRAVCLAELLS